MKVAPMMSFQCSFLVIPVPISLSSQCPDTGIQKKEWCHASSLLLLSSQCLTLGSRRLNFKQIIKARFQCQALE
ncbi:hypothetical protein [Wolbachia endosymbiont (group A) of Pogonocherus hispidulus]|uniref:hypothetical protein n=1 Tax=Wolbachia endosymbiont (group A) of Pogonocherus hispidulus TaxID=3066136 RepID=UPI00333EA037